MPEILDVRIVEALRVRHRWSRTLGRERQCTCEIDDYQRREKYQYTTVRDIEGSATAAFAHLERLK